MKPFGGKNDWTRAVPDHLVFLSAKRLADKALKLAGGDRMNQLGRGQGSGPSTRSNTNRVPFSLREPQGQEEQVDTRLRQRNRLRSGTPEIGSPNESESSSSSSDDDDPDLALRRSETNIAIMTKSVFKLIELSFPLYLLGKTGDLDPYYSLGTSLSFFTSSLSILERINDTPDPVAMTPGISDEYNKIKRCYRNVRINKIILTYYSDYTHSDQYLSLTPISLNITADKPLKYTNSNIIEEWYKDNWYHDNNIYYQVNGKRHDTAYKIYDMGDRNIMTTSGSINSWTDTSSLHLNSLSLNLGFLRRPDRVFMIDEVNRIGVITVVLQCEFATQQTSLGFN